MMIYEFHVHNGNAVTRKTLFFFYLDFSQIKHDIKSILCFLCVITLLHNLKLHKSLVFLNLFRDKSICFQLNLTIL